MRLTRREFVTRASGALAGTLLLPACRTIPHGEPYAVAVLGDLHYDTAPNTIYHAQFIRNWQASGKHPARFKEFIRNARMWAGPSKRILKASGACATEETAFVLQLGDLIQGDCDNPAVHRKMLEDTMDVVKSAYPKCLPFLSVCGNHDIRTGGGGAYDFAAAKPYAEFMIPHVERELRAFPHAPVTDTTFAFRKGPDLYLLIDFNRAPQNVALTKRLLEANRDVRYTFVALHGGVFPFDDWFVRWFYLGGMRTVRADGVFDSSSDAVRREMRAILAERNAIVLCGHTHHLSLKDADFPEGRITEVTMNSVPFDGRGHEFPAQPKILREGAENFGVVEWARTHPEIREMFAEYQPYMTRYWTAHACGHARLRVSDEGVWFDFYGHDTIVPTRTFRLR